MSNTTSDGKKRKGKWLVRGIFAAIIFPLCVYIIEKKLIDNDEGNASEKTTTKNKVDSGSIIQGDRDAFQNSGPGPQNVNTGPGQQNNNTGSGKITVNNNRK
jgi:hypothetical protein